MGSILGSPYFGRLANVTSEVVGSFQEFEASSGKGFRIWSLGCRFTAKHSEA